MIREAGLSERQLTKTRRKQSVVGCSAPFTGKIPVNGVFLMVNQGVFFRIKKRSSDRAQTQPLFEGCHEQFCKRPLESINYERALARP